MLGAFLARRKLIRVEAVEKALAANLSGAKKTLLEVNIKALHTGLVVK